ncbi:MAG: Gfo/Idh/MocA family oxidoreductase [Xylanivirga thermophila]|uniref:hypothetical protein n=1 Tax=Xylanivirga thermophila TaxID=2496273 RepID=UPI0039F4FAB1
MKHIGFIDYYIDEWHANNYPAWIRENITKKGWDWDISYVWAEIDNPNGLDTDSWCKKYNVERVDTIEELVEKSDFIMVLSPDNPENHERFSKLALMSGKPVYIDKTFSPDLASGVRMFKTAEQYNTPMFSSSALRFAEEFSLYPDSDVNHDSIEYIATMGPGYFDNYAVHQIEMIVSLMGVGAKRIKSLSSTNGRFLSIEYNDGRRASMLQIQDMPFQLSMQLKDGKGIFIKECSDTFPRLIDEIMDFFNTKEIPVAQEETLEIMAIIEAGNKALKNYDTWIDISHY